MADDFSKKSIERYRQDESTKLKCKNCQAASQQEEMQKAASKAHDADSTETRICATCKTSKSAGEYNRNQWNNKPEGKARCRQCVEKAVADETNSASASKEDAFRKAREAVDKARASGHAGAILKAESVLSALEAEKVTGLKPVNMSSGRGRKGRGTGGRFASRGRGGRGRR